MIHLDISNNILNLATLIGICGLSVTVLLVLSALVDTANRRNQDEDIGVGKFFIIGASIALLVFIPLTLIRFLIVPL